MTSDIQQLLDTFMDYSMEEQQTFLEIVGRINDIVKTRIPGKEENSTGGSFK